MKKTNKYIVLCCSGTRSGTLAAMEFRALFFAALFATVYSSSHDPTGYVYHDHSITKPYDDAHDVSHWNFLGSTVISDKYIRLTPDRQSRRGSLWNNVQFNPLPNSEERTAEYPSWEVLLEFHTHGSGKKLFGDGFAMWYTEGRAVEVR